LFSKTYDDEFNPQAEFAAILTCSAPMVLVHLSLVPKKNCHHL
jgi:hypothetical protein